MNIAKIVASILVTAMLAVPAISAGQDNEAFGQFQEILQAIDGNHLTTVEEARFVGPGK